MCFPGLRRRLVTTLARTPPAGQRRSVRTRTRRSDERERLRQVFSAGLGQVVGYVLPATTPMTRSDRLARGAGFCARAAATCYPAIPRWATACRWTRCPGSPPTTIPYLITATQPSRAARCRRHGDPRRPFQRTRKPLDPDAPTRLVERCGEHPHRVPADARIRVGSRPHRAVRRAARRQACTSSCRRSAASRTISSWSARSKRRAEQLQPAGACSKATRRRAIRA